MSEAQREDGLRLNGNTLNKFMEFKCKVVLGHYNYRFEECERSG